MKIIGKTADGYLLEATEDDIALAAGFTGKHDANWKLAKDKAGHSYSRMEGLPVGAVVPVRELHSIIGQIRWKEDEAKKGAAALRAIATILEGAMPSVIFPAPPAPAPEGEPS